MQILEGLGRVAVVTNVNHELPFVLPGWSCSVSLQALIIAFTSEFIPKVVYTLRYSPDNSLTGYMNFTLSYFDPTDFEKMGANLSAKQHPEYCRYNDFRYPPEHEKVTHFSCTLPQEEPVSH